MGCVFIFTGFTKLHMGLVVLVDKMSVLINFYFKIPILCQSLARSAQIVLVMSNRNDEFVNSVFITTKVFALTHLHSQEQVNILFSV